MLVRLWGMVFGLSPSRLPSASPTEDGCKPNSLSGPKLTWPPAPESLRHYSRITLASTLVLCSAITLPAAITVVNPAGADHTPKSDCPKLDGNNKLNPDPATLLDVPTADEGVMKELASTNNTSFAGWTFNVGAALSGTLTINYYHSKFVGSHRSGAQIKATYVAGAGDPATLRFVQMIDTSAALNGATSPYIDPYPNDDPTNAPLPFYWTEKETKKFGLTFSDFSKRFHPPTSSVTWRGNLYLTSWDGKTPGTITVHDGVEWGFDAGCVEPESDKLSLTSLPNVDGSVTITWPSNSIVGQIESNPRLEDPSGWDRLTNRPALSNGYFHISVLTPDPQQFFRLSLMPTGAIPVLQPAYIRVSPQPDTVEQGHEAYLSTKADGSLPLSYQWSANGLPIPGATNRDLTFAHVDFTNQGVYTVTVTNASGGETSDPAPLNITEDATAPTLVSARASADRTQIIVTFSEGVNPLTALDPTHYQVQKMNPPPQSVLITNVSPTSEGSTVVLHCATPLPTGSQFLIQAFNITDFAMPPNPLAPGSASEFSTESSL